MKVGDKVMRMEEGCNSAKQGEIYVIQPDSKSDCNMGIGHDKNDLCTCIAKWKLVEEVNQTNKMNLKEKFVTLFISEPEKSFRKVGITNGDGILTEDGQKVFLGWLLKQNGAAFKTEVVDPMIVEEKEAA